MIDFNVAPGPRNLSSKTPLNGSTFRPKIGHKIVIGSQSEGVFYVWALLQFDGKAVPY